MNALDLGAAGLPAIFGSPSLYLVLAALSLLGALRLARGLVAPIAALVRSAAAAVVALVMVGAAFALIVLAILAMPGP